MCTGPQSPEKSCSEAKCRLFKIGSSVMLSYCHKESSPGDRGGLLGIQSKIVCVSSPNNIGFLRTMKATLPNLKQVVVVA